MVKVCETLQYNGEDIAEMTRRKCVAFSVAFRLHVENYVCGFRLCAGDKKKVFIGYLFIERKMIYGK